MCMSVCTFTFVTDWTQKHATLARAYDFLPENCMVGERERVPGLATAKSTSPIYSIFIIKHTHQYRWRRRHR